MEAVGEAEARRRSRRLRLDFLRNRAVRIAMFVLPVLGITLWVLWAYTGLPPDPPMPSTRIGDTSAPPVEGDWPQAGGGVTNTSSSAGSASLMGGAPEPVWDYVAGAPITATPAVVGDRVYIAAEDGSVVAVDLGTGGTIWRYDSGLPAAVTPAIADGLVFVVFRPGLVSALDADTGSVVWTKRLRVASLPSPTVADGRVFVAETDKDRLLALDAANGETLWEYRLDDWVVAPPAIIDGKVIATANDAKIHILDVNTGRLRMKYDTGQGRWIRGGPVVTDDLLHASSNGVRRDGSRARVWGIDYRGHRYPLERQIYRVRTQLGVWGFAKRPPVQQGSIWSALTSAKAAYQPALSGHAAVVADPAGLVTAVDAATGEILWETDLNTDITVPPTTSGALALIGDEHGRVTALSVADGSQLWVADQDGMVTAPPLAVNGLLLVATTDDGGTLTALSSRTN